MPVYQIRIPVTIYEERPGKDPRVAAVPQTAVFRVEAGDPTRALEAVQKGVSDAASRALDEPFNEALLDWDPRDDMTPGSY